jgi:RNA polymerase sigma factor (sigma-70 family)
MSEPKSPGRRGARLPGFGPGSDERLARCAAAGDEAAFASIFERYGQDLYRYCLSLLGNPADAQDALQNTMVKALRSLPGEQRQIKLRPWLYRVAHNESIELLRQRRHEALDPEVVSPDASPAEATAQRQRLRHLLTDLGELPDRQRAALTMRELGGLAFEEIGAALGISAAGAQQTLYEARLGLREMEAGREMECEKVTRALSDGDGRVLRRRDVRAHLRACADCRAFGEAIESRRRDFAAIAPLPAIAAVALLKGGLGAATGGGAVGAGVGAVGAGSAAVTGAGAAGGVAGAGGAGGVLASGLAVKVVATVAVGVAIGAGVADRTGLVHIGGTGDAPGRPAVSTGRNLDRGGDRVPRASGLGAAALDGVSPAGRGGRATAVRQLGGAAGARGRGADAGRGRAHSAGGSAPGAEHLLPSSGHGGRQSVGHGNAANAGGGNPAHSAPEHGKGSGHAKSKTKDGGAKGSGTARGKGKTSSGSHPDHGSHGKAGSNGSAPASNGTAKAGGRNGSAPGGDAAVSPGGGQRESGSSRQSGGEPAHDGGSGSAQSRSTPSGGEAKLNEETATSSP